MEVENGVLEDVFSPQMGLFSTSMIMGGKVFPVEGGILSVGSITLSTLHFLMFGSLGIFTLKPNTLPHLLLPISACVDSCHYKTSITYTSITI